MKFSPNLKCPCTSGFKYKKCCMVFHKGAKAKDALELMKSRYSAYAAGVPKYIIDTTHTLNKDYSQDKEAWRNSIKEFCNEVEFEGLEILEFIDGKDEAYVTFKAKMSQDGADISFTEKSKFIKEYGRWLYLSGEFIDE